MSPRLFGQVSVIKFGLVQCAHVQVSFGNCETVEPTSAEKFAILSLKPRSYVRILIYRTWVIVVTELKKNRSKSTVNTSTEKYDFERLGLNLNCPIFQYFVFYNFKALSCKWN